MSIRHRCHYHHPNSLLLIASSGHATDWEKKAERIATKTAGQPMINLEDVTTEQLVVLFEELSYFNCDDELRRNKVDGISFILPHHTISTYQVQQM